VDQEDKRRIQERHRKASGKHKSLAEQKRLKEEARRRRAERLRTPRTRWRADADDDALAGDARVRGGRAATPTPLDASSPHASAPAEARALADALVVGLARSRARLCAAGVLLTAAFPPGLGLAVGDRVAFERPAGSGDLVRVRALHPRTSWLARPDPAHPERRLVLAANVELVVCVVAARAPRWKPGFVDRVRLAAEEGRTRVLLAVNKVDLVPEDERAALAAELALHAVPGEERLLLSAASGAGIARLAELTRDRTCVLVGPSGVGKSSLVAALDPATARAVGAVRASDGKGRHTTTAAELVVLASGARLIDTPGVRQLGLVGLDRRTLAASFPDFAAYRSGCRFADCLHLVEPGCAVRAAVAAGALDARRIAAYRRIHDSLER
jgi:ribosome biogenesis GTPase